MRYLITFACYGTHLHGDPRGAVDRIHNTPGSRLADPSPERAEIMRQHMDQTPYSLDQIRRVAVLDAIRQVCAYKKWTLWAVHVRTNHVHVVVEPDAAPEKVLQALKAYASRNLNSLKIDAPNRKRWAHHGSTRWLWNDRDVLDAIQYVIDRQGEPMETYTAEKL